jgi:TolB-like protein
MRMSVRAAMALLSLAVFTPAIVQAQAKPVIAVLYFDNNSIGKDHADYDGVGKGIADILITDMASNPNVRIVERERIQSLLVEQNLTASKTIDPQTAIRLGKIIGAQYMITGGFLSNGKGTFVLTARAINVETSATSNPQRLTSRGDDVLGLIAQLSNKLNNEVKLPALQVGQAPMGGAVPAGQPAAEKAPEQPKAADAKPAEAKPAEAKQVAKANRKMDMKTVMLLSKALEEEDAGNRTKAVELYRQVVDKFPDYAPAQQKLKRLSQS